MTFAVSVGRLGQEPTLGKGFAKPGSVGRALRLHGARWVTEHATLGAAGGMRSNHDFFGANEFHFALVAPDIPRFKIKLIRDVLALEVSVVVSDIDTAWVKNPIPYFHRYPEADILTSSDQLGPTVNVRWAGSGP